MKILRQKLAICLYGGTKYLHLYIVLADLKGRTTFPPQQMPHASTYIKIEPLECWGEKLRLSEVRRSRSWRRWHWVGLDLDGGIGASNFYRKLEASWMISKRDFVAFMLSIWDVRRVSVAQRRKLCGMLKTIL
jgi:hypothetical protein